MLVCVCVFVWLVRCCCLIICCMCLHIVANASTYFACVLVFSCLYNIEYTLFFGGCCFSVCVCFVCFVCVV